MTDLIRQVEHEPDQPITLTETDIVSIDGVDVVIPVSVYFQLYPSPRVVIESQALSGLAQGKHRKKIELRNGARLEVLLGSLYFNPEKVILIPVSQPVKVIDEDSPLKEVSFAILNFPAFYGQQAEWIRRGGENVLLPHEKLEPSDWSVTISGVPNVRVVTETLKKSRGYGITYNGAITRSDGATFQANDVEALLEALRVFFSIARGAACSLALVLGKDDMGQESLVRWGAHHSEPWLDFHSAFPRIHSNILSELFPEFWTLLMGLEDKKSSTLRAFDWYLQSNVSAPHIGTLLTLAALEGFSYLVLNRERKKGEPAGKYVERALSKLLIPLSLPNNCQELKSMNKWRTGPHALVDIRNDLIHPRKNLGDVSNAAYMEAWELGQWYFELMFLRILDYQGCYQNRMANIYENEESIVPVPWAAR